MSNEKSDETVEKIHFEAAIDRAGFGLYSYTVLGLCGLATISFTCLSYGSTIIVPTSACELQTNGSQQGMLAAAPVVGLILGGVLWGYLADTRGRRAMLLVSLTGGAIVNLLASISVNWLMLMLLQLIAALFASGLYTMSMTLMSECVPMAKRNLMVLLVASISLLSQGVMSVLAIPIIPLSYSIYLPALGIYWNSWRTVMVVYSVPSMITAVWLFFMQESPKFVYSKGNEDRALQILKKIYEINHFRSGGELQVKGLLIEDNQEKNTRSTIKDQIVPIFRAPLLKNTLIMTALFVFQQVGAFIVWLPTIANQFVRILETGEGTGQTLCGILNTTVQAPVNENATPCALNETSLLMVFGVGVLQSVFNVIISVVVNKVGRRNLVLGVTAVCGLSGILVNLVANAVGSVVLFVVFLLGIVVLGLYAAIMVALFPTHLRTLGLAFAMTFGRVSTFASIQILNLMLANNCDAGFYLFCSLFAVSAVIASFLPDDRRLQLPSPVPAIPKENNEMYRTRI